MENAAEVRLRRRERRSQLRVNGALPKSACAAQEQNVAGKTRGSSPRYASQKTRSVERCAERVESEKSDQKGPKDNHSVERRAGVECGRVLTNESSRRRADFDAQDDEGRRRPVRSAGRLGRHARRRKHGLAASFRMNAVLIRVRAVAFAAAAIRLMVRAVGSQRCIRAAAVRRATSVLVVRTSAVARMRLAATTGMRTNQLDAAIGADARRAGQTGPHRQGNHPPGNERRPTGAKSGHGDNEV